jgi:gustatory receptor
MFQLLKVVFAVGKFLALTPAFIGPNLKIATTKTYPILLLSSLTIAVPISLFWRQSYYQNFIHIKLTISFLMDISLYLFNFVTIAGVPFLKRNKWQELLDNLEKFQKIVSASTINWTLHSIGCIMVNLIFLGTKFSNFYIFYKIVGDEYLQHYLVEIIQTYMLFYYYHVLYSVIKLIRSYYKHVRLLLEENLSYSHQVGTNLTERDLNLLNKAAYLLGLLRSTVEVFNDLFGWPILLMILYTSMMMINYLDDTFRHSDHFDNDDLYNAVISTIVLVLLFFVITPALASIF